MRRFVIAFTLLFFCGSASMANNFTSIINRSSQPMASTLKGKLAEEQTKCWCMGWKRPFSLNPRTGLHCQFDNPTDAVCEGVGAR